MSLKAKKGENERNGLKKNFIEWNEKIKIKMFDNKINHLNIYKHRNTGFSLTELYKEGLIWAKWELWDS